MTDERTDWLALMLALEKLEEGFNEYRLPLTGALAGKKFELLLEEDNTTLLIHFKTASQLEWGKGNESPKVERYEAIAVRPDIFFVDWVYGEDSKQSMSLVLDLVAHEVTLLWSKLPNREEAQASLLERIKKYNELSAVKVRIRHGGINSARVRKSHHRTKELIGKRLKHTYSSQHAFEHIYLNENMFCWQSLAGPDQGLADTEPCDYIKIGEELYLFSWRERLVPWVGIVVIDLLNNRTTGKVFYGDLINPDKITNYTVGAEVEFLNETKYA